MELIVQVPDAREPMMIFRLTTAGGDVQEFTSLAAALTEAGKYLDPERLAASWVKIETVTP